jgi:hypothetical protein
MSSSRRKIKRKSSQQQKPMMGLKRKLDQGPFRGQKIVVEPGGKEKMSDALADFVAPYADSAKAQEEYEKLLSLAVFAWNTALMPKEEQQPVLDKTIDEGLPGLPGAMKADLKGLLKTLIARKQAFFANNRRFILDFDLQDTGNGYHLSVASTVEDATAK